jgi:hypothetical protein
MSPETALILRDNTLAPGFAELGVGSTVNNAPLDYRKEIVLLDGSPAVIRPILSEDKNALVEFHGRLSQDTRFLRYHYSKGDLTSSDLKNFCDVDYCGTLALVVEADREGKQEMIGVGRFSRLPFDHTAEVAFVVQDSEQNKELAPSCSNILPFWPAREVFTIFGEVLRQNARMLSIFRKSDPGMKQDIDSISTCTVTLSTVEAMRRTP